MRKLSMKKSGIPEIGAPSAPGSGGVSAEGAGAGGVEGCLAEERPRPPGVPAPVPPEPRCAWPWMVFPLAPPGVLAACGL